MNKNTPSYVKYAKMNENVVGINWDEVNKDRIHRGLNPLPYKTQYKDGNKETKK